MQFFDWWSLRGPLFLRDPYRGLLRRLIYGGWFIPTGHARYRKTVKRNSIATVGCTVRYCRKSETRPHFVAVKKGLLSSLYRFSGASLVEALCFRTMPIDLSLCVGCCLNQLLSCLVAVLSHATCISIINVNSTRPLVSCIVYNYSIQTLLTWWNQLTQTDGRVPVFFYWLDTVWKCVLPLCKMHTIRRVQTVATTL